MIKLFFSLLLCVCVLANTDSLNHFIHAISSYPHPEKTHKGGEDAYFVHKNIIAVADGVGGWNDHGVDPSLYSKQLVKM